MLNRDREGVYEGIMDISDQLIATIHSTEGTPNHQDILNYQLFKITDSYHTHNTTVNTTLALSDDTFCR